MIQVKRTAFGQVIIIGCRIIAGLVKVLLQKVTTVRNIGIAGIVRVFDTDTLIVANRHAGLDHDIGRVVTLIEKAITADLTGDDAKAGIAGV